ncbi:unnamed protein product [Effrenium voratum]|uniref:Uncharacterized protein n=1 Tax=Effrenium voratum TaxID=2562239 RepID=A0AA36MN71_9DINO|nr:unnamed protein product [Effrenium voratum]CAJ1424412.1 unnamed protein product [Effrenium voratum]CAJ1424414.1 unnamed protein product [Effrenium voratum]
MKLFALVLAVAFAMVSGDEVQHLRGESKSAAKDEESPAVGAVVAEPKEPKEPQSTMDQVPKPAGDVDKEESKGAVGPKAGKLDSPKETEPDVGVVFEEVEGTEEEAEDETSEKEKAAHRPGRRRPWGPSRRRPHGAGCRRWVNCRNGWYGGVRCSGGRHCTAWR